VSFIFLKNGRFEPSDGYRQERERYERRRWRKKRVKASDVLRRVTTEPVRERVDYKTSVVADQISPSAKKEKTHYAIVVSTYLIFSIMYATILLYLEYYAVF